MFPEYRTSCRSCLGRVVGMLLIGLYMGPAVAAPGDPDKGAEVYAERCAGCHGEDGDGLGPGADRLNPPPRDFTFGLYKIKTTGYDDFVPNDEDLYRMIADGMPGTAMPGWSDVLAEQEIRDLIAYLKIFAGIEEEVPSQQIDYGTQVTASAESIERGRQLFLQDDRCSECHGTEGKGNAVKSLKDDNGDRTWPRNLTKPWTFRASSAPKDIYSRISTGIPGTQMPAFGDPASKKTLTPEQRWDVVNFVMSLAKTEKVVRPENTVVKAEKIDGALPETTGDAQWEQAEAVTFFMVPQLITGERLFSAANDTITARALYNETDLAMLLEWDDRTKSIPGDELAEKISDPEISEDSVAIQLPVTNLEGSEKPYFIRGDAKHAVSVWRWASGTTSAPQSIHLQNSNGYEDVTDRDAVAAGIVTAGSYEEGTWKVLMKRSLVPNDLDNDLQFTEGRFIPIAFAAWDGSNSETGSKHTLTTWYWLLLKQPTGSRPLMVALAVMFLLGVCQWWWVRSRARSTASS